MSQVNGWKLTSRMVRKLPRALADMPSLSSRILIVDPDSAFVGELASFFASEDYYLIAAETGQDALEMARDESFDAIICEYRLEGMGGLALIAELRKLNSRLPIVMVTKNPGSQTAIEAIKSGAYDFISKPAAPQEIRKVISEAIAASRRA